ncbi:MAG: MBL fold metallo-hydrolase [Defluviitaleaceae bacterium]|nr:MBL fold metallo-hydrolase [Defluviitaleaceae bacterium]
MKTKIISLLVLLIFSACNPKEDQPQVQKKPIITNEMEVQVFGIGRADAILITTENHTVLIDTGERSDGQPIANHLLSREINEVDYLIITHFDNDHVGGAYVVLGRLDVKNVIIPNYVRESSHVNRFENALEHAGLTPHVLTETIHFKLDNAEFMVTPTYLDLQYSADVEDTDDDDDDDDEEEIESVFVSDDNFSIVVKVTHGENNFLFTGDAMASRLQELLDNEKIVGTDYDFLKVPRHGRRTRHTVNFLNEINPRYAVITGFHHRDEKKYAPERPTDRRVTRTLEEIGAEIFFTMDADVRAWSNGKEIRVGFLE